nr:uncharacterized protein LOC117608437 [Osmia lignaria]
MRFDPAGFTGPPPTSHERTNGNDDDADYYLRFHYPRRDPSVAQIRFFHLRAKVDVFASSFLFVLRTCKILGQRKSCSAREKKQQPPRYRPYDTFVTTVGTSGRSIVTDRRRLASSLENGPEFRNATAFRVFYSSVYRSETCARIPTFAIIFERRKRRVSRFRRCNGHDADRGNGDVDDSDDEENDHARLERFSSTFRDTGSRPPRDRINTDRTRTRGKCDRARPVDQSPIPIVDVTNVPYVDAFAYTAQNDENDDSVPRNPPPICQFGQDSDGFGSRNDPKRDKLRVGDGNGRSENNYTARFQEPITNGSCKNEKELATSGSTKLSNSYGRKYGFLFVMYLLAWPLVCSTTPFAHGPSLGPAENLLQHNSTQISSLFSSGVASQQQQQQQQKQRHRQTEEQLVQDAEYGRDGNNAHRRRWYDDQRKEEEREIEESSYQSHQAVLQSETVHPYNEYSWEVNQINPWLSACDLAGPAPADLQGSCGPPEVPKNCPIACTIDAGKEFLEVIERTSWSRRSKPKESAAGVQIQRQNKENKMIKNKIGDGVRMAPEQCLFYLEESHKRDICRDDFGRTSTPSFLTPRENRYWFMSGLRLRHCCEHAVVNALAPGKGGPLENVLNGGQKCADALDKLLLVDALAARLHCEFEEVLARYDCAQPYSVIFNCTHCKEAYRKWVCSSLVPYFAHGGPQDLDSSDSWVGSRLRPCRSFCQSVEQRCPYLLPGDRAPAYPTQYAGEPTFLCRDPNIPETGEHAARALHSSEEDECCFHACSEENPGSGICANCTDREPRKRGRSHDPPTAPYCEINPIQPASTGGQYRAPGTTDSTVIEEGDESYDSSKETDASASGTLTNIVQQQGTSLCGSGGVGSMTSISSSDRSTISLLAQLFWLCSILTSSLGNVRTIPALWLSRSIVRLTEPLMDRWWLAETSSRRSVKLAGWLHEASMRHVTKWMLEKWVTVEGRCRGCWWYRWCCWCWCWCWCWRWRWRRISSSGRVRWKFRPRLPRRKTRGPPRPLTIVAPAPTTATLTGNEETASLNRPPHPPPRRRRRRRRRRHRRCRRCCCCRVSSTRTGDFGSFAVKCHWRRWNWWWWWLYRWWRSRATIEDAMRRATGRIERNGMKRRRRRRRRRWKGRSKGSFDVFGNDVWHCSATRRYFRLSSRKDPP